MGSESVMRPLGSRGGEVERRIHASAPRTERRIARVVAVQLSTIDGSPWAEKAFTENVSAGGARVVTKQHWKPEERVLLKSLESDFQSQARVMYCQHLPRNVFAVGLDLLSPTGEWGKPC
jgi:PilZ domain-containing protein